jgi:predicted transcriptional regulator
MYNSDRSQRTTAPPLIMSVLKAISDHKALVLFNSIAVSTNNDRYIPLKEMNLSAKQYYSRMSGLLKVGLIKRQKGIYSLTLLGKIVYDLQMTIGKALSYYWKFKAIESIEMSHSDLQTKEITQLVNALIDNDQIKDIIMKSVPVPCKTKIRESTPVIE